MSFRSGIPQSMEWKGVKIDARSRPISPTTISPSPSTGEGGGEGVKDFMLLSGFESSSLENKIFELGFGVEAVSAVKAIQLAHAQGMEVVTITQDNIDMVLPGLDVSDEVREDIIKKVNQGLRLTTHALRLTYFDWIGTGYIALDPKTGEASYLLQGNILGGMTVSKAWNEDIAKYLMDPSALEPAEPGEAKSIRKVRDTDWQKGVVWEPLNRKLQVLVTDSESAGGRPVKGASV